MIADFHLHSARSDGELSPAALMETVFKAGVQAAALTDHDTTAGHDEARARAAELGLRFIGGIEMTTFAAQRVVHVLGLGVRADAESLEAANETAARVWHDNVRSLIASLARDGANLSWERDFPEPEVRLPMLIERMWRSGVDAEPTACHARFRAFFDSLPARRYRALPSPAQAAEVIRQAGGVAILAHPLELVNKGIASQFIRSLDGLEALYGRYEAVQCERLCALAEDSGKFYSCGSDFHGYFTGPYVNPGFKAQPALRAALGIA